MTKQEFLNEIREKTKGLPQSEIEKSQAFYSEMIDDHMEDGMREEEAVAAIGTTDEAVAQILSEIPLQKMVREKLRPTHSLRVWEIVLLVLGSPIWLSLLIAVISAFFSIYLSVWSVIAALYASDLAFAAGAMGCFFECVLSLFAGQPITALLFFGFGCICTGITVLAFFGINQLTLLVLRFSKWLLLRIKSIIMGIGGKKVA